MITLSIHKIIKIIFGKEVKTVDIGRTLYYNIIVARVKRERS